MLDIYLKKTARTTSFLNILYKCETRVMFVAGYIASYLIIGRPTCFYTTLYIYEYVTEFPPSQHAWTISMHRVCFLITASNAQYGVLTTLC